MCQQAKELFSMGSNTKREKEGRISKGENWELIVRYPAPALLRTKLLAIDSWSEIISRRPQTPIEGPNPSRAELQREFRMH
jgi:hypothetical protein